jgi:hypothetical protein
MRALVIAAAAAFVIGLLALVEALGVDGTIAQRKVVLVALLMLVASFVAWWSWRSR